MELPEEAGRSLGCNHSCSLWVRPGWVIYTGWQHCAATRLGKEEFLLINGMMYDMLAAQTP